MLVPTRPSLDPVCLASIIRIGSHGIFQQFHKNLSHPFDKSLHLPSEYFLPEQQCPYDNPNMLLILFYIRVNVSTMRSGIESQSFNWLRHEETITVCSSVGKCLKNIPQFDPNLVDRWNWMVVSARSDKSSWPRIWAYWLCSITVYTLSSRN